MTQISFQVTKAEAQQIDAIVARYGALRVEQQLPPLTDDQILEHQMDLTACHANGCPLDLERMLAARPFDLAHDVTGIANHLDRTTGQLTGHFLPRFAR